MKKLRETANLDMNHIANYLSVDQNLITKFEEGECIISSDVLTDLSTLFCYPLSSLISDEPITQSYNISCNTSVINNKELIALSAINKIALNQEFMDRIEESR